MNEMVWAGNTKFILFSSLYLQTKNETVHNIVVPVHKIWIRHNSLIFKNKPPPPHPQINGQWASGTTLLLLWYNCRGQLTSLMSITHVVGGERLTHKTLTKHLQWALHNQCLLSTSIVLFIHGWVWCEVCHWIIALSFNLHWMLNLIMMPLLCYFVTIYTPQSHYVLCLNIHAHSLKSHRGSKMSGLLIPLLQLVLFSIYLWYCQTWTESRKERTLIRDNVSDDPVLD